MSQLRHLDISHLTISDSQLQQIRQMAQLEALRLPDGLQLYRLLASGHCLMRLKDVGVMWHTPQQQEGSDALATVSSLIRVGLLNTLGTHIDFVLALYQLFALMVQPAWSVRLDTSRVLSALRQCSKMTDLHLTCSASPLRSWRGISKACRCCDFSRWALSISWMRSPLLQADPSQVR